MAGRNNPKWSALSLRFAHVGISRRRSLPVLVSKAMSASPEELEACVSRLERVVRALRAVHRSNYHRTLAKALKDLQEALALPPVTFYDI